MAADDEGDQQRLEFVAHPRAEGLRGQAIFVFAHIALVVLERKAEDGDNNGIEDGSREAVCSQRKRVMRTARSRMRADQRRFNSTREIAAP